MRPVPKHLVDTIEEMVKRAEERTPLAMESTIANYEEASEITKIYKSLRK